MKVYPDCIFNGLQPQLGMRSVKNEDVASACSSVDALGRLYGMNILCTWLPFIFITHIHAPSIHTYSGGGDGDQLLSVQRLRRALQDLGGHIRSSGMIQNILTQYKCIAYFDNYP